MATTRDHRASLLQSIFACETSEVLMREQLVATGAVEQIDRLDTLRVSEHEACHIKL